MEILRSCLVLISVLVHHDLAAELRLETLDSEAIGRPVEYAVLLPESGTGSESEAERYPLVLLLHGAGGDRHYLERERPIVTEMWEARALPRFVMATASVPPGTIYMDDVHGRAKWETFMMREFLPHLRSTYPVSAERRMTIITGISMGGAGSARLAFKYPGEFGAVAMMEPGVWAGTTWDEVPGHLKIRTPARQAALFGDPFDTEYWAANNPASIVASDPERIRRSGLEIYLECGDLDGFGFHENAEFLHRLLWDERIPHEYRLVRWADHVGSTLLERSRDRFDFVARYLGQPALADPDVERFRSNRARRYRQMGYEPFPFWPDEPRLSDP